MNIDTIATLIIGFCLGFLFKLLITPEPYGFWKVKEEGKKEMVRNDLF